MDSVDCLVNQNISGTK